MRIRRSSYTLSNYTRFSPYFNEVIKEKKSLFIAASRFGISLSTLQQQCSDALRFICLEYDNLKSSGLMDDSPYTRADYMELRAVAKICLTVTPEAGVVIRYAHKFTRKGDKYVEENKKIVSPEESLSNFNVAVDKVVVEKTWRDKIVDFLENGESGIVLDISGLKDITEIEKAWIHKTLNSINCDYVLNEGNLRAVK